MRKQCSNSILVLLSIIIGMFADRTYGKQRSVDPEEFRKEPTAAVDKIEREWTNTQSFDGNEWFSFILNDGSWSSYQTTGNSGGVWPRGTSKSAIFTSGLWIGAIVDGEVRVTAAQYGSDFSPGPISPDGEPGDPWDPAHRVYKVNRWDGPGVPDWDEWPTNLGAPVGDDGNPYIPVDQTLFTVHNDLMDHQIFGTSPLGAEVRQTTFGGVTAGESGLNRTFYIKYEIINKSETTWENALFSIWSDPDLGDAVDDLIGVDVDEGLAFCYNDPEDNVYGIPPAVGYQLLQGPVGDNLSAFSLIISGGGEEFADPWSAETAYNRQLGLTNLGNPVVDPTTGMETTYMVSGNPVTGEGWVDSEPADRRILTTSDGGNVAPGEIVTMIIAVTIAQGTDNLNSITELRQAAAEAKDFWNNGFAGITLVDRPILSGESFLFDVVLDPADPGQTTEGFIELSNGGNQSLTGTIQFPAGSDFLATPASFSIAAGGSETILINFSAPEVTPTIRNVPNEYTTIQEAVNASQISLFREALDVVSDDPYAAQEDNTSARAWMNFDGDVTLVEPGTYVENVVVEGKVVHLEATGSVESTIIDGNESGSCLQFINADGSSIKGFTIENGYSDQYGGGIFCDLLFSDGFVSIIGNRIQNNHSENLGGGVYLWRGTGIIAHNLIINNSAVYGGGVRLNFGYIEFSNNTLWGNSAQDGSGLYIRSSEHHVVNNIVWANEGDSAILVNFDPAEYLIEYSDIEGGWDYGEGNINVDPLFVDSGNDDFHLQDGSPCIDAGHPDLNGNGIPWYQDPEDQDPDQTRMDMGAFFRQSGNVVISPRGFTKILHVDEPPVSLAFEIQNWGDEPFPYVLEIVSADSTYILYVDEPDINTFNGDIWKMRPDGSEKTPLTFGIIDREPAWSPDGSQIVFWSYRSGNADIWVMDADGSNMVNLTDPEGATDANPHWSPDGTNIIFSSNRDESTYEIYRMAPNGDNVERLTFNDFWDNRPRYSPDGQHIATSSRITGGDYDIYVYTSDGQSYINIGIPDATDYQPSWSPDGKRVVWCSYAFRDNLDIVSANIDGSAFRFEFGTPQNEYIPRLSPDGQFLAFSKSTFYPTGGDEIFVWNRAFRSLNQITDNTIVTREWGPDWSPFLEPPEWVMIDHDLGVIVPGGVHTVFVDVDRSNLPLGIHSASVLIRNSTNGELVQVFPVNIRLTDTYGAEIVRIVDVPQDQGGYVHVRFLKSLFDTDPVSRSTEFYTLWRRLPGGQWEGLRSIGALNDFEYVILGETLQDATIFDYHETEFRITAHMDEGTFVSESFWGASWDNIAPGVPGGFVVNSGPDFLEISWEPGSDEDFQFFRVYRVTGPDFDPIDAELVLETIEPFYGEYLIESGQYFYTVTAADVHWNESDFSEVVGVTVNIQDEVDIPVAYALRQNYPNPFNPLTTVRYDLPERANVTVTIYDILGRKVRTLVQGLEEPGFKSAIWDGTNDTGEPVSTGLYYYQIKAGDFTQTRKMIMLK